MKIFYSKLYFTCILILEVEKEEKFIQKLQRKEKISESQQGICSKKQMGKQTYAGLTSGGLYDNGQATLFFWRLAQ